MTDRNGSGKISDHNFNKRVSVFAGILFCPLMNKNPLNVKTTLGGAFMNYLWAFIVGGLICTLGQLLIDKTKLTPARILVGFVCAGVVLGAVGVYDSLIDFAGAGATLPISGFGSLLAKGTREAVDEQGLLGAFTGPLTAGSAGIMAAVLSGLVLSFVTKPKPK